MLKLIDPVDEGTLWNLFSNHEDGSIILTDGEHNTIECKATFHPDAKNWLRTVAALANNQGGYLLFGIRDEVGTTGKWRVTGLKNDEFQKTDLACISRLIRTAFNPTPTIKKKVLNLGPFSVGVLHVSQHPLRPVIATRSMCDVSEGDIYYRYDAESTKIKHSELRSILDSRDERVRSEMSPMIDHLLRLGPQNALVADLRDGDMIDGRIVIRIDDKLVESLNIIKEGHLSQEEGSPAYRLIGEILYDGKELPVVKDVIGTHDMIIDFLTDVCGAKPEAYIQYALQSPAGKWMPIFYYADRAQIDSKHLIDIIHGASSYSDNRTTFVSRIKGETSAYRHQSTTISTILDQINKGIAPALDSAKNAGDIGLALQCATEKHAQHMRAMKESCLSALDYLIRNDPHSSQISNIRRGAARLDELAYRSLVSANAVG